jgi:FkbM family methyltransferase
MKSGLPRVLSRLAQTCLFQPLARWRESRLPDEDVVLDMSGMKMKVFSPRRNRIGRALYVSGIWEPEVTGAFRALIKPGDTVFDIGGDAGYYTLLFRKCAGESGHVVVFEPIPKAYERIKENLALNAFTNCTLVKEALGSQAGSFVLERPFEDSRINLTKSAAGESDITVQVERFDTLADQLSLPVPDLIKIDVEGAELEVLRGMERLVADHHPDFVIELHPQHLPQFGASVEDVLNWLRQRGYQLRALDAGEISTSEATTFLARVLP